MASTPIPAALLLILASTAMAQPAITFDIENPVLRPGQSTTVTVYASYGSPDYAVAGLITDFITSVGSAPPS